MTEKLCSTEGCMRKVHTRGMCNACDCADRRARRHAIGRVCAETGCKTRLSRYNPGTKCSIHDQDLTLNASHFLKVGA